MRISEVQIPLHATLVEAWADTQLVARTRIPIGLKVWLSVTASHERHVRSVDFIGYVRRNGNSVCFCASWRNAVTEATKLEQKLIWSYTLYMFMMLIWLVLIWSAAGYVVFWLGRSGWWFALTFFVSCPIMPYKWNQLLTGDLMTQTTLRGASVASEPKQQALGENSNLSPNLTTSRCHAPRRRK